MTRKFISLKDLKRKAVHNITHFLLIPDAMGSLKADFVLRVVRDVEKVKVYTSSLPIKAKKSHIR